MIVVAAWCGERFIKERFKDVVEEIGRAMATPGHMGVFIAIGEQVADEIFAPAAPGFTTLNSEPAFFLQKVKKDDLAEKLLREIVIFQCRVRRSAA